VPEPRDDVVSQGECLLRFRFARNGTAETLYVSGELDVASGPALERRVAGALDGRSGDFRLDIRALTFMDSTGAEALLRVQKNVESLGRRLVVVSPTGAVGRVFELMGLYGVLDVRDERSVEERCVGRGGVSCPRSGYEPEDDIDDVNA
jgi:stage II sporulation protein AA (anti-sigma F factor antagonist)